MRNLWNWIERHIIAPLSPIVAFIAVVVVGFFLLHLVAWFFSITLRPELVLWFALLALALWALQYTGALLTLARLGVVGLMLFAVLYFFWPRGDSVADVWKRFTNLFTPSPSQPIRIANGKTDIPKQKQNLKEVDKKITTSNAREQDELVEYSPDWAKGTEFDPDVIRAKVREGTYRAPTTVVIEYVDRYGRICRRVITTYRD